MAPDIYQSIQELDCGELDAFIRQAALDTASSVVCFQGKGKVAIELSFDQAKGSGQLLVSHKVSYAKPTAKGKRTEEHRGDTLVYVDAKGSLSVMPHNQTNLDFETN